MTEQEQLNIYQKLANKAAHILPYLTGIEYKRLTSSSYSDEEKGRIMSAKEWTKTCKFTHIYILTFGQQSIYTAVKKVKHTQ